MRNAILLALLLAAAVSARGAGDLILEPPAPDTGAGFGSAA